MYLNAENYSEHHKEFFNQKLLKKIYISLFFICENYTLSIDFYVKLIRVIYIYFKINFEKSLGNASSFT